MKKIFTSILILSLVVWFFASPKLTYASVALADSKTNFTSAGTSVTATAIVPSGSDRYGIVKVAWFSSATVSSITWGGVNITANLIKTASHDGSSRKNMAWFYYLNPPASSGDVIVTLSGSTAIAVIAEAWSGVDQTSPYGDLTATTDTLQETADPATKTITATSGKTVTDGFFMWGSGGAGTTMTLGGSQTLIQGAFRNFGGGATTGYFGTSYGVSTGSLAMSWDPNNAPTLNWAMYIISLNPSTTNTASSKPIVSIQGQAILNGKMNI